MDGWMMNGWMDDEWMDDWMDEWMIGWMDGWMDGWIYTVSHRNLQKDGVGYKKIAKTLRLSCSPVAKTIQRFTRTGSTQNSLAMIDQRS